LLFFNKGGSKYEIKCCNILRNRQSSSSNGIIFAYGNTMIENSCILENTATCIFYAYSSYTITVTNCTVDKTSSYGSFKIQNTFTKSFIHGLNHLLTQNCNAEYDSIGTLTAVPYVPSPTKKEFRYTFKNNCEDRISISFSIIWLLMFAFIYPNPSVNY
jgi:hypothetical protein